MTKNFLDVFSGFRGKGENTSFLQDVTIERMSTNKNRDTVRLYMNFPTLIPKRRIHALEKQIRKGYFKKKQVRVVIIEKFSISGLFTPKVLYDSYKDSILEELEAYSAILYSLFSRATLDFDEAEHLLVSLEDTIVAHEREQELHDILDRIFCERCGQRLIIDFAYKKTAESRYRKESDITIQNKVGDIATRLSMPQGNDVDEMLFAEDGQQADGVPDSTSGKGSAAAGQGRRGAAWRMAASSKKAACLQRQNSYLQIWVFPPRVASPIMPVLRIICA